MRHVLAVLCTSVLWSGAASAGPEEARWSVIYENDMHGWPASDENYTMGVVITYSRNSYDAEGFLAPAYRGLASLNRSLRVEGSGPEQSRTFWTLGSTNFTPVDIVESAPIPHDRPYASLLYLGVGYTAFSASGTAIETEWQLGLLGTDIGKSVQSAIHRHCCTDRPPRGWSNQVGEGGSPTFLYHVRWRRALSESRTHQLVGSIGGEVGYYTRIIGGATLLYGARPADLELLKLGGVTTGPRPYGVDTRARVSSMAPGASKSWSGFSMWLDYELSLFAYNQLLQGAWTGTNNVRIPSRDVKRIAHKANGGVELTFIPRLLGLSPSSDVHLYYTQSWRSKDITGARDHYWGGLTLSFGT